MSEPETTVEDELALAIGAAWAAGLTPNAVARALIKSGWTNPTLPYLDELKELR